MKLTLDSKVLNNSIHKKYKIPKIELLIGWISLPLTEKQNDQQACFSAKYLEYAFFNYNYRKILQNTAILRCFVANQQEPVNLNMNSMVLLPAEFRKTMDYTLIGLQNTFCFLDDIIIDSTGA